MREERLKHVADIRISNVDKKSADGEAQIRLCNYTDVYYNDRITGALDFMGATASRNQRTVFGLRLGDVLLTKDSETAEDIGVSAFVAEYVPDLVCGYHLALVRPLPGRVLGGYLRWSLASLLARQRMSAAATGVTRFGLRSDAIADLPVPIPPIATQRAIVDYLDRETARIDALVAAKQRMVELLGARFTERARVLLTGGAAERTWRPGPYWLGPVPRSWAPKKIAWHKRTGSGTTPTSDRTDYYSSEGGTLWVTTSELREGEIFSTAKHVTIEALCDYSALTIFPPGTVLVAMYGATVGRIGVLRVAAATNQACCAILGEGELDQDFMFWWLRIFRSELLQMAYGSGQPNISQETIRSLRIPAPTLVEQQALADEMAIEAELLLGLTVSLNTQIDLLQERRQALITDAVTGQLDIPEAA